MHPSFDTDYFIVGSGFGGSVSALRLAEKGYRVTVAEQGRRFSPADMPASTWDVRRFLWLPALACRGFFALRLFKHMLVLHGNADPLLLPACAHDVAEHIAGAQLRLIDGMGHDFPAALAPVFADAICAAADQTSADAC